jgi:GNAT superfamily N-acetyltransferase
VEALSDVIDRAKKLKFHSLEYVEPEEKCITAVYELKSAVIILERVEAGFKAHWAADSADALLDGLGQVRQHLKGDDTLRLEFVPPESEPVLAQAGFKTTSEWIDFWLTGLNEKVLPAAIVDAEITPLTPENVSAAHNIILSCWGQSRGFEGEVVDVLNEWLTEDGGTGFLAVVNGRPAGVALCAMYGFDSPKGPVCWLRELAVSPACQNQGFGRALALTVLKWGQEKGATRSFLATDVENYPAIHLYEKLGYRRQEGRGQINMELRIQDSGGRTKVGKKPTRP